jgi:NAD+--asparagine ADP-ribosyltransferase
MESHNKEIESKVENSVESPKVQNQIEHILDGLSDEDKNDLMNLLDDMGIDEYSTAQEIHNKIENSDVSYDGEMSEYENPKNAKHKVREILHNIGAGNIAAWGGVPTAIAIGSMTGMPLGFAISWGVTGLLMGLAKVMGKK